MLMLDNNLPHIPKAAAGDYELLLIHAWNISSAQS
jgi:hypothetical protein